MRRLQKFSRLFFLFSLGFFALSLSIAQPGRTQSGTTDQPMVTAPNIYELDQQTGDQVITGSFPSALQIGDFDPATLDSLGNALNEIASVGTSDPYAGGCGGIIPFAPPSGYSNFWSVFHTSSDNTQTLTATAPDSFALPLIDPNNGEFRGYDWPAAAELADVNGDNLNDLLFVGSLVQSPLGPCFGFFSEFCSIFSALNNQSANFFDAASLNAVVDTENQFFAPTVPGTEFITGLLGGQRMQSLSDVNSDGKQDIIFYDFGGIGPSPISFIKNISVGSLTGPSIITMLNNSDPANFGLQVSPITLPSDISCPWNWRAVDSGDFNGDQVVDIALLFDGNTNEVTGCDTPGGNDLLIFYGTAGSLVYGPNPDVVVTLSQSPNDPNIGFGEQGVFNLAHGNFDNDGFTDFVIGATDAGLTGINPVIKFSKNLGTGVTSNHIVTCTGTGACAESSNVVTAGVSFPIRNAVADFNSDGLDDIAVGILTSLLVLVDDFGPTQKLLGNGEGTSKVMLCLNQGGAQFPGADGCIQVFQTPLGEITDPNTGQVLFAFDYALTDLVAGNLDNCGGPDLAYSSVGCFAVSDSQPRLKLGIIGQGGEPTVVCFNNNQFSCELQCQTPQDCIDLPECVNCPICNNQKFLTIPTDEFPPGAISVVFNKSETPELSDITVGTASNGSVPLSVTCTTDGGEASQITWTLLQAPSGVTIENADSPDATLVVPLGTDPNATVEIQVVCKDACNPNNAGSASNEAVVDQSYTIGNLVGGGSLQGACNCDFGAAAAVPNWGHFIWTLIPGSFVWLRLRRRR